MAKKILAVEDTYPVRKILIVDDTPVDLIITIELVEFLGYVAVTATNGIDALKVFEKEKPSLVLMDILMEGMDGYEVSKSITTIWKDKFIPIIFITALDTVETKVKCFENGGVDLIVKPFNVAVLRSKIKTFMSLSALYATNNLQRKELESYNKKLKQNYEVASDVFDKVMHSEVLNSTAIKYSLSPIAIFNGDILLAAYRPGGQLQVMLGDFTGHGISAAIGAIPVADIFYGMTEKDYGLADILQEINNKMLRVLPRGLFLAVCFIEYNPENNMLILWNGGLPDVLIYNKNDSKVTETFQSRNYPLGISEDIQTANSITIYCCRKGDRLLMFTDGVIETRNEYGELYGVERVINNIKGCKTEWLIDYVQLSLTEYSGGQKQTDDTTIFEMDFIKIEKPIDVKKNNFYPKPLLNSNWKLEYFYGASILKIYDPIPIIIQTIMEMQKLQRYKCDVFIIFRELFVNALDHGLLSLDSKLKHGAQGFANYIAEKESRLTNLEQGNIKILVEHSGTSSGGILDVFIEDTGSGFSGANLNATAMPIKQTHGRGIFMVNKICACLNYNDSGNKVHASYHWSK